MKTNINGIIIDGKVYESVKGECKDCAFQEQCKDNDLFNSLCNYFEAYKITNARIFSYSQTLTEKLNKE